MEPPNRDILQRTPRLGTLVPEMRVRALPAVRALYSCGGHSDPRMLTLDAKKSPSTELSTNDWQHPVHFRAEFAWLAPCPKYTRFCIPVTLIARGDSMPIGDLLSGARPPNPFLTSFRVIIIRFLCIITHVIVFEVPIRLTYKLELALEVRLCRFRSESTYLYDDAYEDNRLQLWC